MKKFLLQEFSESMEKKINNTEFKNPSFKIINNVIANPENNSDVIKKLLVKQIYSTVKWRESLIKMNETGVKNFIEIGPGKALIGMVKRTIKEANCFSINSITDMKNFVDEFKR